MCCCFGTIIANYRQERKDLRSVFYLPPESKKGSTSILRFTEFDEEPYTFTIFSGHGVPLKEAGTALHHNLSPVHEEKFHLPIYAYNHLLNDGVPALRAESHLKLFQLPVKYFQGFPLFSPRAFLLLNRFALPLKCLVLPRQITVTLAVALFYFTFLIFATKFIRPLSAMKCCDRIRPFWRKQGVPP